MFRFFKLFAFAALSITLDIHGVAAQAPTPQQRDAIRAACRSDFMTNCSGVQPGGREALNCLFEHSGNLSASCKAAVEAVASPQANPIKVAPATSAPPASAAPPAVKSREDQIKAVQQACTLNDLLAHCSWIAPTSPELVLCLRANTAGLSPACLDAVQSPPSTGMDSATVAPAPSPSPTAVKSPAPLPPSQAPPAAQRPSDRQLKAVRAACRSDFMAHCSGVQPGGPAALRCLQQHSRQLSHSCQSAVAALGRGQGGPAAGPVEAAAPSGVAPIGPMPMLRPREALAIVRICSADQRALCPDVQLGGGRLLSCLAEHASALSPSCYGALSAAARR
jgi:hypothetical protein